jgi:hypothetical protein
LRAGDSDRTQRQKAGNEHPGNGFACEAHVSRLLG